MPATALGAAQFARMIQGLRDLRARANSGGMNAETKALFESLPGWERSSYPEVDIDNPLAQQLAAAQRGKTHSRVHVNCLASK